MYRAAHSTEFPFPLAEFCVPENHGLIPAPRGPKHTVPALLRPESDAIHCSGMAGERGYLFARPRIPDFRSFPAVQNMTVLLVYLFITIGVSFLCSILEAVLLSITPSYLERLTVERPGSGRVIA